MSGTVLNALLVEIHLLFSTEVGTIISSITQMGKLRHRMFSLAQVSKWHSQD